MKTTLNIHDALLTEAKALAARQHLSLTRLIEEGLRLRLRGADASTPQVHRPMPVAGRTGSMAAGLSGLNTRELLDAADSVGPHHAA